MATTEPNKVKLKLMIDKSTDKVIFAEAGTDFIDVLFNLLSLTFSTVIRLLGNGMDGCLGNLYGSLQNLNPRNKSELQKLNSTTPVFFSFQTKFYSCSYNHSHSYVTNEVNTKCPSCPNSYSYIMSRALHPLNTVLDSKFGIMEELVTYMVTDDLMVTPGSMTSSIGLLHGIVKDLSDLEERIVEIDTDGVLELVKFSLQSKAALTTVFLKKKECKKEPPNN